MPNSPNLTSTELGTLWMTFQQKTMIIRMLEYFIEKADDEDAKGIMTDLYGKITPYEKKLRELFESEGAVVPIGFTKSDVNTDVPKLYDNGFDIMFVRLIKSISMGMHALHLSMSYREDILKLYQELTAITQECEMKCTKYLLEKGLLSRAPYVTMPKSVEFVEGNSYLGGLNPFGKKRSLNTVEVGHIYYSIEANVAGMQMITGFAQCASINDVKKYFSKGIDLAKSVIKEFSEMLLEDGIQVPETPGAHATRSAVAPFSDKLMMYCVSLFCSFSLGNNALGTAFSLRNDIPAKGAIFTKDIFEYAHEGAKIMIKHGWMEEPPQMEERNNLVK